MESNFEKQKEDFVNHEPYKKKKSFSLFTGVVNWNIWLDPYNSFLQI